tara:strand:- start:185 stop:2647 length:2463 start_codon:yes stop_codon:yes gene_type:complete
VLRCIGSHCVFSLFLSFLFFSSALGRESQSKAEAASLQVVVFDQLNHRLPAEISLVTKGKEILAAATNEYGEIVFHNLEPGQYQVVVEASQFQAFTSKRIAVLTARQARVEVRMTIGSLHDAVVVTAAAKELPESVVGAPVTVIDQAFLSSRGHDDVLESLRMVPGVHVSQTGARGGSTNLFVRGGEADFNKIFIDGVPANDIGGAFDFGTLTVGGVERVEVLRTANSVLFGSDALGGVVDIRTPRGQTKVPELVYSIDAGNLSTMRQDLAIGGVIGVFDYFLDVSQFDTANEIPDNEYHNDTFAGRFGYRIGATTDLSATVRHIDTRLGLPGPTLYSGIANNGNQKDSLTFFGVTATSQWHERVWSTVKVGFSELDSHFVDPEPTGEMFDPFGFGANYLGAPVVIRGGNGYETSGRAILDYGGTYPSVYDSETSRRSLHGQIDYRVSRHFEFSQGFRVEKEKGVSGLTTSTERINVGWFMEARSTLFERLFLIGGLGVERNDLYGRAVTPRLSAAYYLRAPGKHSFGFSETKLTFNVGTGIKAPNVFDEQSSLFLLLQNDNGDAWDGQPNVQHIAPERSRSIDVGIEQGLLSGRGLVRLSFFNNSFFDLIQYVNKMVLPQVGVPVSIAQAVPFGATVNASSYHARGLEMSGELLLLDSGLRFAGGYTFLNAVVTKSFSSDALAPAVNPNFPDIQIGQFSPLVGERPFRRPTHSGTLSISYTRGPATLAADVVFMGDTDDSTFLSDAFFGSSLLLPNKGLNAGFSTLEISAAYRIFSNVRWYFRAANVTNTKFQMAAGFPSLGRTIRSGFTLSLGAGSGH